MGWGGVGWGGGKMMYQSGKLRQKGREPLSQSFVVLFTFELLQEHVQYSGISDYLRNVCTPDL